MWAEHNKIVNDADGLNHENHRGRFDDFDRVRKPTIEIIMKNIIEEYGLPIFISSRVGS